MSELLNDKELRESIKKWITLYDTEGYSNGTPQAEKILEEEIDNVFEVFQSQKRLYAESEYQTHVYLIRVKNGRETWGGRIAYEGRQIYGDIAGSKEKIEEKLSKALDEFRAEQRASIK